MRGFTLNVNVDLNLAIVAECLACGVFRNLQRLSSDVILGQRCTARGAWRSDEILKGLGVNAGSERLATTLRADKLDVFAHVHIVRWMVAGPGLNPSDSALHCAAYVRMVAVVQSTQFAAAQGFRHLGKAAGLAGREAASTAHSFPSSSL